MPGDRTPRRRHGVGPHLVDATSRGWLDADPLSEHTSRSPREAAADPAHRTAA